MIAARRARWNFALEAAVEHATRLGKPLVVLEALRVDYRWASDRHHRFVLDGMADNARRLARLGVLYHPYVEPSVGAGKGLLATLGRHAAVVVTDEFPSFFISHMLESAGRQLDCRLQAIDGNGLLPLRAATQLFPTAYAFRRFLQRTLPAHLGTTPIENPLSGAKLPRLETLPGGISERWPAADERLLSGDPRALATLPIDHRVVPVPTRGGPDAAAATLTDFLDQRLDRYTEDRNEPEKDGSSRLSSYLHFGHLSVHEIFDRVAAREAWSPERIAKTTHGQREGFWGMSRPAEAFLDQCITWREVGYNFCHLRRDHDQFDSLPDWARATLGQHAADPRQHTYSLDEFDAATTHDPLWNAAQGQLRREGRIHNYLRMLWGKKILEWTRTPDEALEVMIELNNRHAVDGRNPNSYSGIFWVLGRYDRPWGPERPIFGKIRYMTSANTARKYPVKGYIERYSPAAGGEA